MAIRSAPERAPLLRKRTSFSSSSVASSKPSPSLLPADLSNADAESQDDLVPAMSTSRGAVIIASIGILIFLQAVNISILTTTQSAIAADLDAFEKTTWLTSSYLIAMSSLAPLMGRLSQLFSPRLCMFYSSLIVCFGTVITSWSPTFTVFMVGRCITGAGAGGILIIASIIVIQMTSHERRGLYIGLINAGMTVGVSLGAVIGGALEPKIGWRVLFGIQAPIGLLAAFGLFFGIPTTYIKSSAKNAGLSLLQKLATIDYSGAISLTATIVLFLFGLSGPRIWPLPIILSAIVLPLFVLNEIYVAKDPVIPITVLKSRGTLFTCLATTGFMMARWTVLFYTPVYNLAVRGWAPAAAGSILIPTNAGFALGGLLAGIFHIRRSGSFYAHCLVSMGLFPLTFLVLSFISTPDSPWVAYVITVFTNGLLTGASLNYTLVHLLHLTPPSVHPIALSLLATFRGFAGSFGSAIGGGIFERVLYKSLVNGFAEAGLAHPKELIRKLMGSPALVRTLHGKEKVVAVQAYENGIKSLFGAAIAVGVMVVILQASTGWKEAEETETAGSDTDTEVEGDLGEQERLFAAS